MPRWRPGRYVDFGRFSTAPSNPSARIAACASGLAGSDSTRRIRPDVGSASVSRKSRSLHGRPRRSSPPSASRSKPTNRKSSAAEASPRSTALKPGTTKEKTMTKVAMDAFPTVGPGDDRQRLRRSLSRRRPQATDRDRACCRSPLRVRRPLHLRRPSVPAVRRHAHGYDDHLPMRRLPVRHHHRTSDQRPATKALNVHEVQEVDGSIQIRA
jgi:hypothetical protein